MREVTIQEVEALREKRKRAAYRAIGDETNLSIFNLVSSESPISFETLQKRVRLREGLLGERMGLLSSRGLVKEKGHNPMKYVLSEEGEELTEELKVLGRLR